MQNINSFAKRLKALRERKQLTQSQLAEIIGVSSQTISSYEKKDGGKIPALDKVIALAKVLETSLDYLCAMTDTDSKNTGIENYADMMFYIDEILSALDGTTSRFCEYECSQWEDRDGNYFEIDINDQTLVEAVDRKRKMRALLSEKTIDVGLYTTWEAGETERLRVLEIDRFPF